jgi:hypothetical protein
MQSARVLLLPSAFVIAAAGLLGAEAFTDLPRFAIALALTTIAGAVLRAWSTFPESRPSRRHGCRPSPMS